MNLHGSSGCVEHASRDLSETVRSMKHAEGPNSPGLAFRYFAAAVISVSVGGASRPAQQAS